MDVAALIVAIVGLLVAGLSAGWQVATWFWSNGRPKARLMHGVVSGAAAITGPVKRDGLPLELKSIREQGYDGTEVLGVQVVNHGRAQVTVTRYSIALAGTGMSYHLIGDAMGPPLPHRIQPGEAETWYADMDTVHRFVYAAQAIKEGAREVFIEVTLGTGRTIRTRQTVRI
ncbi:hypothetical protein EV645_3985 [Kribbella rubisoli]|uniref:Phosphoribosylamine--glycine ligase n=1 Tax=Kribbella rubisoli TaxID=3075929 RepID=A0A4Q7X0U7_9ACTN|nr:phosphoribosylamine--glycine ligase [Kribbella rubisoli]RZU16420.1 hypothetical protein EV645_3985 [Kribbella rubisoli]